MYETLGDKEFTADAVMAEFIHQYTDEDVENVFGAKSEHDYVRKVGNECYCEKSCLVGQMQISCTPDREIRSFNLW